MSDPRCSVPGCGGDRQMTIAKLHGLPVAVCTEHLRSWLERAERERCTSRPGLALDCVRDWLAEAALSGAEAARRRATRAWAARQPASAT